MRPVVVIGALVTIVLAEPPAAAQATNENGIFESNKGQTLRIVSRVRTTEGWKIEKGTGVIVSPEGHVLTALHVVGDRKDIPDQDRNIEVAILDSRGLPYSPIVSVLVENASEKWDLAVLRITGTQLPHAEINTQKLVETPLLTAIIWNPNEKVPRWESGKLNVTDPGRFSDMLTVGIPVIPGNSGAPVYDSLGKLVAITTHQHDSGLASQFSLAVPMSAVKDLLPTRSEVDKKVCIKTWRSFETRPQVIEPGGISIECDSGDSEPTGTKDMAYSAPPGFVLGGLASHTDETNEHGWVETVEYGAPDRDGRITAMSIRVGCNRPDRSSAVKGWAKTELRVTIRKVLDESDEANIEKRCVTR